MRPASITLPRVPASRFNQNAVLICCGCRVVRLQDFAGQRDDHSRSQSRFASRRRDMHAASIAILPIEVIRAAVAAWTLVSFGAFGSLGRIRPSGRDAIHAHSFHANAERAFQLIHLLPLRAGEQCGRDSAQARASGSVSYTHLDVYKRQAGKG